MKKKSTCTFCTLDVAILAAGGQGKTIINK